VNDVGVYLNALTDDTVQQIENKFIVDETLNAVAIATGVACVALSITYTAMSFVPGAGTFATVMLALSIAADVINCAFTAIQTMEMVTETGAYINFENVWKEYKKNSDLYKKIITLGNSISDLNLKLLKDPKGVISERLAIANNVSNLKNASSIFTNPETSG
jgi:hypothetical protein